MFQVPAQTCYPETICHKTPHTKCFQTRSQQCSKVVRPVPVEEQSHQCLPFPGPARPQPVITPGYCAGGAGGGGYDGGHGLGGGHDGFGGHVSSDYSVPSGGGYTGPTGTGVTASSGYAAPSATGGVGSGYGAPSSGAISSGYNAPSSGGVSSGYNAPSAGGISYAQYGNDIISSDYNAPVSGAGVISDNYGGVTHITDDYGNPIGGLLTVDAYSRADGVEDSLGAADHQYNIAAEGGEQLTSVMDSAVSAALDRLHSAGAVIMSWLPGPGHNTAHRRHDHDPGHRRHRQQHGNNKLMDGNDWMPIDNPLNQS